MSFSKLFNSLGLFPIFPRCRFTIYTPIEKTSQFIHQSKDLVELSWNIKFLTQFGPFLREEIKKPIVGKSNSIFDVKNKSNWGLNKNSVLLTLLIRQRGKILKKALTKLDIIPESWIILKMTWKWHVAW
jgi:hypothetical protein